MSDLPQPRHISTLPSFTVIARCCSRPVHPEERKDWLQLGSTRRRVPHPLSGRRGAIALLRPAFARPNHVLMTPIASDAMRVTLTFAVAEFHRSVGRSANRHMEARNDGTFCAAHYGDWGAVASRACGSCRSAGAGNSAEP